MAKLGTLEWAQATGGKLRLVDKLELARQSFVVARKRQKQGGNMLKLDSFNLDSLTLPDTQAVKQMADILEQLATPELIAHSYRTFYWGALLAKANHIQFDAELLMLSAQGHDLGLVESAQIQDNEHCFSVTGARMLEESLADTEVSAEKMACLQEAITLHMNLQVPQELGAEAHLLNAGAVLDVVGGRKDELAQDIIDDVLVKHPRLEFKHHITECFCQQCISQPHSRVSFMMKRGLKTMVSRASFSS